MGQVTDDMILEAVIFDGTPSRQFILAYVAGLTFLSRDHLANKVSMRLRSLVKFKILKEIIHNGQKFYCFPDTNHPAPIGTPLTKRKQIQAYIDGLPRGYKFTVKDIQAIFSCDRDTVYGAIYGMPNLAFYRKSNRSYVYIKGAVV